MIKEGLNLLGIKVGTTLKPIEPLNAEAKAKLKEVLRGMNVL